MHEMKHTFVTMVAIFALSYSMKAQNNGITNILSEHKNFIGKEWQPVRVASIYFRKKLNGVLKNG